MITIENLTKKYGDNIIFDQVSCQFPSTGLVCLLGASGSGKSTLLNMLAGFDSTYDGKIHIGNLILSDMNKDQLCAYRRDHIGFIFQNYCLLPGYTVLENVTLPCRLKSEKDASINEAKKLLERVGMTDKTHEKIENLSGGQKQRAAIARALMGNPDIILADEPTGALDSKNTAEIMSLLKEAAAHRLVIVITHDSKVCKFADQVIQIQDKKILTSNPKTNDIKDCTISAKIAVKPQVPKIAFKNFRIHFLRYMAVSAAVSMGILAFLLSLSYGNVMQKNISDFQEKNTAFGNGYVKTDKELPELFNFLSNDERVENVFYQYRINDVTLSVGSYTEVIEEKYPMPKASEKMSYGIMPRCEKKEIALSPSLAKKFSRQINDLIGKELILTYRQEQYPLTVSGIFNAGYDDFFVSVDIEKQLYEKTNPASLYALNYDVKNFDDVVQIAHEVERMGTTPETAASEVAAMQTTFKNIQTIFFIISVFVLCICIFISAVLLIKMQNTRYHEFGLLSALGFGKNTIQNMIFYENVLLTVLSVICCTILSGMAAAMGCMFKPIQLALTPLITGAIVILIGMAASLKPLHTQPADALRK